MFSYATTLIITMQAFVLQHVLGIYMYSSLYFSLTNISRNVPCIFYLLQSFQTMIVQPTRFAAFVAVLLISGLSYCSAETVYCVTPTATSCSSCPHNSTHCTTLAEYDTTRSQFLFYLQHHYGVLVR